MSGRKFARLALSFFAAVAFSATQPQVAHASAAHCPAPLADGVPKRSGKMFTEHSAMTLWQSKYYPETFLRFCADWYP